MKKTIILLFILKSSIVFAVNFCLTTDTFCRVLNQTNSSRIKNKKVDLNVIAPYKPMLNNSSWLFFDNYSLFGPPTSFYYLKSQNDTIINTIQYKKITLQEFSIDSNKLIGFSSLFKFVREDTNSRKVYREVAGIEQLIFDFNLLPGDTFTAYNLQKYVVQSIDSILLNDGYHRKINFALNNGIYYAWIEGVCHVPNILNPNSSGNFGFTLRKMFCSFQDSNVIYNNILGTAPYSCGSLFSSLNQVQTNHSLKIYPNPNAGIVNVLGIKPNENIEIKIYDLSNKTIYAKNVFNVDNLQLDISHLNNGFYFLHINQQRFKIIIAK